MAALYRFGGSPLSGTIFESKNICIKCGKLGSGAGTNSFGNLYGTRRKYTPIEPISNNPATLEELVKVCKNKR